jgi:MFS family permease
LGGVIVSIALGYLADRYGYQKILKFGISITGLSTIAIAIASSVPMLAFALFVQAMVSVAFFPLAFATISKLTSLSERAMAVGIIIALGVGFGMGATPLLLGLIADHFSFQAGILSLGIVAFLSYFLVGTLKKV